MHDLGSAAALATPRSVATNSPLVSAAAILIGWSGFLSVEEDKSDDAMPIRSLPDRKGPRVLFHAELMPREAMDHPAFMAVWIPMALNHFASAALVDSLSFSEQRYTSERWLAFRGACADAMDMTWTEIVEAAERETAKGHDGADVMADQIAAALFIESGVQASLAKRGVGTKHLRLV